MQRIISSEKYREIVKVVDNKHGSFMGVIDTVLEEAGIEVEEPPVMRGVTAGAWLPCCGHDADQGKYYIFANGVKIAEVYVPRNRLIMAGSKNLAEKVIAMFETWSSGGHGKEALGMLTAMETMGFNMDKFR